MLWITLPASESWDERKQEFVYMKEKTLQLEHSLVSLSKWESKWCKPFLSQKDMSVEEIIDYVKCMTITQNVSHDTYNRLTSKHIQEISEYINSPMTATTFTENKNRNNNREVVTAEIIYHWMIALQIPSEYQKWHLNRLLTLIRVCENKNSPPKKMGKRDTMNRYASLNAARRKQLNSKG